MTVTGTFDAEVTLDFSNALNVRLDNDLLHAMATVGPNQSKVVAVLHAFDNVWNTTCNLKLMKTPAVPKTPKREITFDVTVIDLDFPPSSSSIMPESIHNEAI